MPFQSTNLTFLKASWVLPIDSPPLEDGVVAIAGNKIVDVLDEQSFQQKYPHSLYTDYGAAIILPGLVNLHTHLDYSSLRLSDSSSTLFPWVLNLMKQARQWKPEQWDLSAFSGACELALSGTSLVADCSYTGRAAANALASVGLRALVGLELFGLDQDRTDALWQDWLKKKASLEMAAGPLLSALNEKRLHLTVSPHAPYTVSPSLWHKASQWAQNQGLPLLTHLCESVQECRWIAGQDQTVDDFLASIAPGFLSGETGQLPGRGQGLTPVAYLKSHGLLNGHLVAAHMVHARQSDIEILADRKVYIAHCPRSNARLHNGIAPVPEFLQAGVNFGFGTDSAASNDDLNVLSEARFSCNLQRGLHPGFSFSAAQAVEALTLGGARALGMSESTGSLTPGKLADLAIFSIDQKFAAACDRPYDLLLYGGTSLRDLIVDGKPVVKNGAITSKSTIEKHLSQQIC